MLLSNYDSQPINPVSVRLLGMAHTVIDEQWNAADVCTTYWRCYINEDSGARVRVGDNFYALDPGCVHFIPAWVTFSCLNSTDVRHFYAHFDLIGLPAAVVRASFPTPVTVPIDDISSQLFEQLSQEDQEFPLIMGGYSLVYHSLRSLMKTVPPDQQNSLALYLKDPFNGLIAYIEQNLPEKLLNRDLAYFCHLSEDYFIKQFKSVMKVSPNQYLTERRVARASELLVFSDETIDSIAESCGFPNRHYFTRVFTKYMGLPPGQFRKSSHP